MGAPHAATTLLPLDMLSRSCLAAPLAASFAALCAAPAAAQAPIPVVERVPLELELVGRPLAAYPFFEVVRAVNEGQPIHVAIDPTRVPEVVGNAGDLYVVENKTAAQWDVDLALVDARGAPQPWTVVAGDVQTNTLLADAGTLPGTSGTGVGIGYDVVLDLDGNGLLGPPDVIDGRGDEGGFYVVRDTAAPGPYAVEEVLYDGGFMLEQDIYYPSGITGLGALPLIVVSHGNGHNYQWYDHLGHHMASYGYVVMSHYNNTGPGIESASETTLTNTDHFLGNLDTIAGGVLDGHVDGDTIVWIGHSRGAEGVARAYDRLFDAEFVPASYDVGDVRLVSSIAPTTFLGAKKSDPHGVPYHLWVGSADADVAGAPGSGHEPFALLGRAKGTRAAIVLQGMGHGVFHDGGGSWVADGPCQNGPIKTHTLMRGYFLPLCRWFVDGDVPSKDFLWRQYEAYQPIGKPDDPAGCVVVTYELHERKVQTTVIDDFDEEPSTTVSSSGQPVSFTVIDLVEGVSDDANTSLSWNATDPFNGMTRASKVKDVPMGIVFSFDADSYLEFALDPAESDLTDDTLLSFRACQASRHPYTVAVLEDVTFDVTLRDTSGATSTIDIGAYGGGIEEPYQRERQGTGAGWGNEFETIRIRLTDFLTNGSGLDLASIEAVRFQFGPSHGSPEGRLGLDDVELVRE